MVIFRFRILILSAFLALSLIACNEDARQQGAAALQDPRYEIIPALLQDSQWYYFSSFVGEKPGKRDSLRRSLRSLGEGQYVQYELYNTFTSPKGVLELDVLESMIDTGDSVLRQKVRDQRFEFAGDSLKLIRFDTQGLALHEVYEVPVADTVYRVYNLYGFAHQSDYTPTHRVFWTEAFGSFLFWYGDWSTHELTHTSFPINQDALLALRAEIRQRLAIPFPPTQN